MFMTDRDFRAWLAVWRAAQADQLRAQRRRAAARFIGPLDIPF